MKTLIMAGGKGTRIASIASDIPKPMIPVQGKPILEYQIECLKRNGLKDIIMAVGHLGGVIKDHFGNGEKFGCSISYYTETEPLGSGGALFKLYETLDDDFILVNGDLVFDLDFSRMIAFHREKNAWATLAVHPNSHPEDSVLIVPDGELRITEWRTKEEPRLYYRNLVNTGIHILSKKLLRSVTPVSEKIDLDREILRPAIASGHIFAYPTPEYVKDMGTPERYEQVSDDIKNGLVEARNLTHKQKAIFLDRDGTINKIKGFITRPEDFELIDGAAAAVARINRAGFLAIVITNQPVIARGDCTLEELSLVHQKMESELGKSGAYIDDLFFCPHHPDRGFPGERPEYKIECECRKPKPGMILEAAKKYHIDLGQSFMVGDDMRDIKAGLNAGCVPVLLNDGTVENSGAAAVYPSLKEFAEHLPDFN